MPRMQSQPASSRLPGPRERVTLGLLLLVGALVFLSARLTALSDAAIGTLCLLFALPLLWTLFWRARVRRRAFRDFYLKPDSNWHFWIRGGPAMLATRGLMGLALALLLVIGLARAESPAFWVGLLVMALLWSSTYGVASRLGARHAHPRFHRLLATRLHLAGWFSLLLAGLFGAALFAPVPDVRGLSVDEAVMRFTAGYPARSQVLDWGLAATEALRALPHWLMQNLGHIVPGKILSLLAWSLVLVRDWLFVWPLLLLFQAAQDILDGRMNERLREAGLRT